MAVGPSEGSPSEPGLVEGGPAHLPKKDSERVGGRSSERVLSFYFALGMKVGFGYRVVD